MTRGSGSSSRSTKPIRNECPLCGKGETVEVVVTRSFAIEDRRVQVPGILAWECLSCGERTWPAQEIDRARRVAAVKAKRVA